MYDYLIVGAGLYGAVCAQELSRMGRRCLVIDRRQHPGGNLCTREVRGIQVHQYGAHIFHTASRELWDYACRFAEFNHFINCPLAVCRDGLYNLPFNMNTFSRLWGIRTPEEARNILAEQTAPYRNLEPRNLEEQALKLVGPDIYEKLIRGYTEKQWGRSCRDLPAFLIRRLPCRFTYDNNYFNDPFQGIPREGYTRMVEAMLEPAELLLGVDYRELLRRDANPAAQVIYTGCIDEFFDYRLGPLQYRSLRFETEVLEQSNFQGNAVINYTDRDVPYTRILEHKHFAFGTQDHTVITREYPDSWAPGKEPFYPINDAGNDLLHRRYLRLASGLPRVHFGGRLGSYRYLNMDQTIAAALSWVRTQA